MKRSRQQKPSVQLKRLAERDPRITSYEFDDQTESHRLYLAPGFWSAYDEAHSIHADRVDIALWSVKSIEPCDCGACRPAAGGQS